MKKPVLKISALIEYGDYFFEEMNGKAAHYWYHIKENRIYSQDHLLTRSSFASVEEIVLSGQYAPVYKTDVRTLEKEFLHLYRDKDRLYEKILDSMKKKDASVAFRIYIKQSGSADRWQAYKKKRLEADAIRWCRQYGIAYSIA